MSSSEETRDEERKKLLQELIHVEADAVLKKAFITSRPRKDTLKKLPLDQKTMKDWVSYTNNFAFHAGRGDEGVSLFREDSEHVPILKDEVDGGNGE